MPGQSISVIFLIALNTVPLVSLVFFDRSLFSIVFLYWIENDIVGFYLTLRE